VGAMIKEGDFPNQSFAGLQLDTFFRLWLSGSETKMSRLVVTSVTNQLNMFQQSFSVCNVRYHFLQQIHD